MGESTADWFARRMGAKPPTAPPPAPPVPPMTTYPQTQQPAYPQQQPPSAPPPGAKMERASASEALSTDDPNMYAKTLHKQAMRDATSMCPGCGGTNYLARGQGGTSRQVCFDCGYPNDHQGPN